MESKFTELEKEEFYNEMYNLYYRSIKDLNYAPNRYMNMLEKHGAYNTAIMLIGETKLSDYMVMAWEKHRLDLTIEAVVCEKWKDKFQEEVIKVAELKLTKLGYVIKSVAPTNES